MDDPLKGRTILVAEDDHALSMALEDILVDVGARVMGPYASTGESLAAVRSERVDGALLDFELLHGHCVPVANALLERGLPFVLVTGHPKARLPAELQHVDYLPKPARAAEILAALRQAFHAARPDPPPL